MKAAEFTARILLPVKLPTMQIRNISDGVHVRRYSGTGEAEGAFAAAASQAVSNLQMLGDHFQQTRVGTESFEHPGHYHFDKRALYGQGGEVTADLVLDAPGSGRSLEMDRSIDGHDLHYSMQQNGQREEYLIADRTTGHSFRVDMNAGLCDVTGDTELPWMLFCPKQMRSAGASLLPE